MKKKISIILFYLVIIFGMLPAAAAAGNLEQNIGSGNGEEPKPMIIETVKTDDFEMRFFRFGTGPKPLVILPGLSIKSVMEAADAVASAYQKCTDDYTVYVFDRRSSLPPVYSVHDMARDTEAAFDKLGIRDAYIFSVSQGAMIAQWIALDRPDLVHKMMLGSSASYVTEKAGNVISSWISLAEEGDAERLNREFAQNVYSEAFYNQYGDMILAAGSGVTEAELDRFVILAKGIRGFNTLDELNSIRCPVLVIGSEQDRIFGSEASLEMAEKINCPCYLYKEYGHAVYDEAPDYLDRVLNFFKE